MNRRGFLFGGGALIVAAPAVIRIPQLLMPIKAPIKVWDDFGGNVHITGLPPGTYNMTLEDVAVLAHNNGMQLTFKIGDQIIKHTMRF